MPRQRMALPVTEDVIARLLRLPLVHDIQPDEQARVIAEIAACVKRP